MTFIVQTEIFGKVSLVQPSSGASSIDFLEVFELFGKCSRVKLMSGEKSSRGDCNDTTGFIRIARRQLRAKIEVTSLLNYLL